jgi:AcrR family transcriptional regulator
MNTRGKVKKRMTGDARRAQIVRVARNILIEQGYGNLSLRAVASGCDVRVATIQYFFRDKATLFEAVVDSILSEYDAVYERLECEAVGDTRANLRNMISFLVEDNRNPKTAGLFYEIWNLAHRDAAVRRGMQRLYDAQLGRFTALVQSLSPKGDPVAAVQRAAVIMAATEGLLMIIGYGKKPPSALLGASRERLVDILMDLATPNG